MLFILCLVVNATIGRKTDCFTDNDKVYAFVTRDSKGEKALRQYAFTLRPGGPAHVYFPYHSGMLEIGESREHTVFSTYILIIKLEKKEYFH